MKRIPRDPKKFEVLDLYTTFARLEGYRLNEIKDQEAFLDTVSASLKSSHANPNLLHGKRAEAMFAHVAGALGHCVAIKTEDAGDLFVDDMNVQAPDYRIVLTDRSQLLIEVKNCHIKKPDKPFSLDKDYVGKLQQYADLFNVPLKFAIYFSAFRQWVLLPLSAFDDAGQVLEITLPTAFAKSEMAMLGDVMIATLPKLRMEFHADPNEASKIGSDGIAAITFRSSKFFCAGTEITEPAEMQIAFFLIRFGSWSVESEYMISDEKLLGVAFTSTPEEQYPDHDLPYTIVGNLSSMVSAAFSEHTVDERTPIALDTSSDPDVFALRIPVEYQSDKLPLLRLIQQPNPSFGT